MHKPLIFAFTLFAVGTIMVADALATECPKDAKSCKVMVITPEEEQALLALISNTGIQGPFNQVKAAVDFWIKKVGESPAGEMPKVPAPPDKK